MELYYRVFFLGEEVEKRGNMKLTIGKCGPLAHNVILGSYGGSDGPAVSACCAKNRACGLTVTEMGSAPKAIFIWK